jgi:hypothetical protein
VSPNRKESRYLFDVAKRFRAVPGYQIVYQEELASVVSLRSTCRQVYHEVTGIFYGVNEFTLLPYDNSTILPKWVSSMGSKLEYLSKLAVGLCAIVSLPRRTFTLLPLLRLMWARSERKLEITLSNHGYSDSRGSHRVMGAMNGALVSIAVQDTLDIRKYSKYSKLLSAV